MRFLIFWIPFDGGTCAVTERIKTPDGGTCAAIFGREVKNYERREKSTELEAVC